VTHAAGRYQGLVAVLTGIYSAPEQSTYIIGRWNDRALKAESVAKKNKTRYYVLRIGFISLATLVPPVVTAQTAVTGNVRSFLEVCAIVLSSLVAVAAALLEITKPGQRWRLYQRLRYDLEAVGWDLAESRQSHGEGADARVFERFVERTEMLLKQYADDYFSEIAQIASVDRERVGTSAGGSDRISFNAHRGP
jgi:hypothetical protein